MAGITLIITLTVLGQLRRNSQYPGTRDLHISTTTHYERISGWNRTELATFYWTQWRGALYHILHTRRWHRTVNWHWEWPDPLQLDRTWEEQSVHQHCSAGCQLTWEVREGCSNSTVQPHIAWVLAYILMLYRCTFLCMLHICCTSARGCVYLRYNWKTYYIFRELHPLYSLASLPDTAAAGPPPTPPGSTSTPAGND